MEKTASPWSMPVAVDEIPDTGLHMEIEAVPEIRAAIAKLAGVHDVAALSAVFDLARHGAGVHVTGRVRARVGQTCVVTLDPVENEIDEAVDVRFIPGADAGTAAGHGGHAPADDEEPPETLVGGTVDLGQLATEFLVLGIDPYPRKPGAEFTPPAAEEPGERPFAALEALKKRLGGGNP
jgi:hypothetical protein